MPYPGSYRKGDHRAVCDVCGQTFLASQMRMRWDNLFVCKEDWEIRHPQDFVRGVPDDMRAEPARPRPEPTYVDPDVFTGWLLLESRDYILQEDDKRIYLEYS